MKKLLILTFAAGVLVGCSDPEAEANKLFTEASQLVKEADGIDDSNPVEAYNKRKAAVELIEKVPVRYPSSSLSVKISEGNFQVQGLTVFQIKSKARNCLISEVSKRESYLFGMIDELESRNRHFGSNPRIVSATTDLNQLLQDGFSKNFIDASILDRFSKSLPRNFSLAFEMLYGSLRHDYTIKSQDILLVGLPKTYVVPGQGKKSMGFQIETNTIHIGAEIARMQNKKKGDRMYVGARQFTVANSPIETGTLDDTTIFARLEDAQSVLGLAGKITEIEFFESDDIAPEDSLAILRNEVGGIRPKVKVVINNYTNRSSEYKKNVLKRAVQLATAGWIEQFETDAYRKKRAIELATASWTEQFEADAAAAEKSALEILIKSLDNKK
jgi:hypothetical protein